MFRSGFIGDEAFVERMQERLDGRALSPEISRRGRPASSLEAIEAKSAAGNQAIQRAYTSKAYSLTDIARHFGLHVSTASRMARGVGYANYKT